MSRARRWDPDWITRAEAQAILDVGDAAFRALVERGRVTAADRPTRRYSRTQIEALAAEAADWIDTTQAADILGVNRSRVGQLVDAGLLPCERLGRRRVFRRTQVQVIANARRARWHDGLSVG